MPLNTIGASSARLENDPEALAKHAITLLERHLLKTHGIVVPMGIELEFSGRYPARNDVKSYHRNYDPYTLDHIRDYTPGYRKVGSTHKAFYRHSPSVTQLYREDDELQNPKLAKNEIVFSHLGAYGPLDRPRLHNLAQTVHHERCKFMGERNPCPTLGRFYKTRLKYPFPSGYFEQCTFDANVSGTDSNGDLDYMTHGMHVNLDFVRLPRSRSLFYGAEVDENNALGWKFADMFCELSQEVAWLIAPDQTNYERWAHRVKSNPHDEIVSRGYKGYIENRLPAANSNPYYAILLNLAATALTFDVLGTKSALKAAKRDVPAGTNLNAYSVPNSLESAQSAFANETMLRDLLNKLEPNLGNRFHAAILKTPPGTEQSAYRPAAIQKANAR